ncbi:MAG: NAD(+) synthase [Acidobacteria bacterium]|nr:NAD(+) synthase [Acidobacteriota bacterium]
MTSPASGSARDLLRLDGTAETDRICEALGGQVRDVLKRRGLVLGLSGGIDSSVCAALAVRALGKERVIGLFMPEEDSSPDSLELGRAVADWLGIRSFLENVTPMLEGAGCYHRRDEAIRSVLPEYGPGYKSKLVLPPSSRSAYNIFSVVVESPEGVQKRARLTGEAYLAIVAATNFKQRVRKMMEYYYADRFNYAVLGTPNRLEYDQGFFVKNGDGSADVKPIAHLYKTQVYRLAEVLGVPEDIRRRPPTTDTYSLAQSQEEFYFALPYDKLDVCLYGLNHGMTAEAIAPLAGLTVEQVAFAYKDIRTKRTTTGYLHERPLLVDAVPLAT